MEWLASIRESPLVELIRPGRVGHSTLLVIHLIATALTAGAATTIAMLSIRRWRTGAPALFEMSGPAPPWWWLLLGAVAILTGVVLALADFTTLVATSAFLIKLPLVVISVVLSWILLTRGRATRNPTAGALVPIAWIATLSVSGLAALP